MRNLGTAAAILAVGCAAASAAREEVELRASATLQSGFVRIRLLAEGGDCPQAIAARVALDSARAGGAELEPHDAGLLKMETEVERPDGRVLTWLDLKGLPPDTNLIEQVTGRLELLVGGEAREVRVSKLANKRRKLSSAGLKKAGVEVSASVSARPVVRLLGENGTGRITGLRIADPRIEYHATTDPAGPRLTAHVGKKGLPDGVVVDLEVTDASGKVHAFQLEDLAPGLEPSLVRETELAAVGVRVELSRGECHLLRARAVGPEHVVRELRLVHGDEELFCEPQTLHREPTVLEVEQAYSELPKNAELAVRLRVGAEWTAVPLELTDLGVAHLAALP